MTDRPESILIVLPNWLGDVAMCTPALRTLRQCYPDARITVTGPASACDLIRGLPHVDAIEPFPRPLGLFGMLKVAKRLRQQRPDIAFIFPHSFRAALLAWLARSTERVGYDRGQRRFLLTRPIEPHTENGEIAPVYMVWEYLDLLKEFGCEYDGFGLELAVNASDRAAVEGYLDGPGPFVGFAPGAAFGPSKRWPADRYAEVADRIHAETGARCVLLTGPGEEETREAVMSAATAEFIEPHGGTPSIERLKAAISKLDLLIGNDSGPRHVAVAFDVPVICIMGSTSPAYSCGPYEKGEVVRIDVDCGPCQQPTCPEGHHKCMTGIDADRVVAAARAALGRQG